MGDPHFRALDSETGEVFRTDDLPAGGNTKPMIYQLRPGGKQFVVIAGGVAMPGAFCGRAILRNYLARFPRLVRKVRRVRATAMRLHLP